MLSYLCLTKEIVFLYLAWAPPVRRYMNDKLMSVSRLLSSGFDVWQTWCYKTTDNFNDNINVF